MRDLDPFFGRVITAPAVNGAIPPSSDALRAFCLDRLRNRDAELLIDFQPELTQYLLEPGNCNVFQATSISVVPSSGFFALPTDQSELAMNISKLVAQAQTTSAYTSLLADEAFQGRSCSSTSNFDDADPAIQTEALRGLFATVGIVLALSLASALSLRWQFQYGTPRAALTRHEACLPGEMTKQSQSPAEMLSSL
jgi:hypothetical protein